MRYPSPPVPLCQPERAFSFAPALHLISTFVAPLPPGHPERRELPVGEDTPAHFAPEFLRRRDATLSSLELDLETVAHVLRQWFTYREEAAPGALPVGYLGNAVTLTRILTVIDYICSPRRLAGDDFYQYSALVHPRAPGPPGGNFAALIWLAWRYVHLLSERVLALDDELAAAPDATRAHALVHRFVQSVVRRLRRAVDFGRGRPRRGAATPWFPLLSPSSSLAPDEAELCAQRNLIAYAVVASEVFSAVVDLLACAGHVVALARRLLCPFERRLGLEYGPAGPPDLDTVQRAWARLATMVRPVVTEADARLLDGYFVESAHVAGVTPTYWWMAQRDMVQWVRLMACQGVMMAWGLLPGEPDSFQRAGPRCMPTHCGIVDPRRVYRQVPVMGEPEPGRPGARSMSEIHLACVKARRDDPEIPLPPGDAHDVFAWKDLHADDLAPPAP